MTPPKLQTEELDTKPEPLITAIELERNYRIPKASSYRLAKAGEIPHYRVGPKRTGVRFIASEVLAALRQPVNGSDGMVNSVVDEKTGRVNGNTSVSNQNGRTNSSRQEERTNGR